MPRPERISDQTARVRMPQRLFDAVDKQARIERRSMSDWIRIACELRLEQIEMELTVIAGNLPPIGRPRH